MARFSKSREENRKVFENTKRLCESNERLKASVARADSRTEDDSGGGAACKAEAG